MDDDYRILEADDVTIEMSLCSSGSLTVSVEQKDTYDQYEAILDYILSPDEFFEYCEHIKALYKEARRMRRGR